MVDFKLELGVPVQHQRLEVDGVQLAVAREGVGSPLVCLHAIAHGARDFEGLSSALKDSFDVIRVDWPDHGRSGHDPAGPDPARYADLLEGVLRELKVERPIILGNSIGGAAAIHYASHHPVSALVLCNAGGLLPVNRINRAACALFEHFFGAGAQAAWWFPRAYRFYYEQLVLPMPAAAAQRERIITAGLAYASLLAAAWRGFGQASSDIRAMACALEVPIWVAWAKRDKFVALKANLPAI